MRFVMANSDFSQVLNANLAGVYIQSYVSEIGIRWKRLHDIADLTFLFLFFLVFRFGCF